MAGTLYLGSQKVFPISTIRNDANITSLTISPSVQTQVINATGMTDGYSPITVQPVTNAIDSGIAPQNIRNSITILNVTGTYEGDMEKILQEMIAGNNPVNVSVLTTAETILNNIATRT